MWQLCDFETGEVIRDNLSDQWDACVSAMHKDGTRFKKVEALEITADTVVYKERCEKRLIKVPTYDENGFYSGEATKTTIYKELRPYKLKKK